MATAVVSSEGAARPWRLKLPERLPDLRGKWLTLYKVIWIGALLLALVAPIDGAVIGYRARQQVSWNSFGFIAVHENHHRVIKAVFSPEARRAGIAAGDLILALDGSPVSDISTEEVTRRQERPDGGPATLTILKPDGSVREATVTTGAAKADEQFEAAGLTRSGFNWEMLILALAPALFLIPAAAMLLYRRSGQIVPLLLSLAFLLFTASVGAPSVALASWLPHWAQGLVGYIGWGALLIGLVTFPNGRFEPRWSAIIVIFFPLTCLTDALMTNGDQISTLMLGAVFVAALIALIIRYRRVATDVERQQLRWGFFGFVAGLICLLTVIPFLFVLNQQGARDFRWDIWLPAFVAPIALFGVPLMALGLLFSVQKYRLYDADAVIGRSAAYGVLTLGFIALFAGVEKLAEILGERYFEHSIGIVAGAVGAAVAAAVIVPLHNRVHRWAERRFQKPLIRLRERLPELVADLRESAPLEQLVSAVMSRVEIGVRSTREAVLLVDDGRLALAGTRNIAPSAVEEWQAGWQVSPDRVLDCDRRDPTFPLCVRLCIESAGEPETIGWLLLGPRPDGSFFGRDEREALAHVAGPVARAIHIAQLRERREEQAEKRIGALESLVAKMFDGLSSKGARGAAPA